MNIPVSVRSEIRMEGERSTHSKTKTSQRSQQTKNVGCDKTVPNDNGTGVRTTPTGRLTSSASMCVCACVGVCVCGGGSGVDAGRLYATTGLPSGMERRHYEERVREVEKASFVPLVFCASGGQGKAASAFLKRIASMLAEKRKEPFSMVMAHLRCRLGFALIRSAIASLRGHRSRRAPLDQQLECPSALVNAECRLG